MNDAWRASFERRVRALAELGHRGAATDRERAAADYLGEQIRSLGLEPERESFEGSNSFGGRILIHVLVAALAGACLWAHPVIAIALDAIVLASLWAENTARGAWLSRPLVRYESTNVCAWIRVPSPRLRVIVSGHYDTQRTGIIWHISKYLIPAIWWFPRILKPPLLSLGLVVFAQAVLSVVAVGVGVSGHVTTANCAILGIYAVTTFFIGEWSIGSFVPGAGDNASGAAAALAIAEAWRDQPCDAGIEMVVLLPSCEESGLLGASAWVERHRAALQATPTIFINFDNLGVGPTRFLDVDTPLFGRPIPYPPAMVSMAAEISRELGLKDNRPDAMPGPTDGLAFLINRLPGMTIVSFQTHGYMPWYHLPGDTADHLDFDLAWQGVEFGWRFLTRCVESGACAEEAHVTGDN